MGSERQCSPLLCFFFFFHGIANKKQRSEGESHCALGTCHIATAGMLLQLRPQTTTRDTRTSSFCCGTQVQQACSVAGLRDRRFGANIGTQLFFFLPVTFYNPVKFVSIPKWQEWNMNLNCQLWSLHSLSGCCIAASSLTLSPFYIIWCYTEIMGFLNT